MLEVFFWFSLTIHIFEFFFTVSNFTDFPKKISISQPGSLLQCQCLEGCHLYFKNGTRSPSPQYQRQSEIHLLLQRFQNSSRSGSPAGFKSGDIEYGIDGIPLGIDDIIIIVIIIFIAMIIFPARAQCARAEGPAR